MKEIYNINMTVLQPRKPVSDAKCRMVHGPTCVSCSFVYLLPALKRAAEPFFL